MRMTSQSACGWRRARSPGQYRRWKGKRRADFRGHFGTDLSVLVKADAVWCNPKCGRLANIMQQGAQARVLGQPAGRPYSSMSV